MVKKECVLIVFFLVVLFSLSLVSSAPQSQIDSLYQILNIDPNNITACPPTTSQLVNSLFPSSALSLLSSLPVICDRFTGNGDSCTIHTLKPIDFFNETTSTYGIIAPLTNPSNDTKNLTYFFMLCRCKEALGNPPGICLEDFPHNSSNCLITGPYSQIIGQSETLNITLNVTQYDQIPCGALQVDILLDTVFDINTSTTYTNCDQGGGVISAGLIRFCNDCPTPTCGDGFVDKGEECDLGSQNGVPGSGCSADCKIINCPDDDHDGVCNQNDTCPNSKPGEPVDKNGCDQFQFCSQFICGDSCTHADFKGDEPNKTNPYDCTVVLFDNEGYIYPKCVPINPLCTL